MSDVSEAANHPQTPRANKAPAFDSPFRALWTGVTQQFYGGRERLELGPDERLEGRTCLVTGANSGLGKAIATRFAELGAHVIMACRSDADEALDEVRRVSGSNKVELVRVELTNRASIAAFCDSVYQIGRPLDVCVFNAGAIPNHSRTTDDGFDLMFAVNFLAKPTILNHLLSRGLIPNGTYANNHRAGDPPRILFISSEAHRMAEPLPVNELTDAWSYGAMDSIKFYGRSKMLLTTYATELARRLTLEDGSPDVCVHSMCPGGVNSNMAREAPPMFRPIAKVLMSTMFKSPYDAALPISYIAASREVSEESGLYFHMHRRTEASPTARDPKYGAELWAATQMLLDQLGMPTLP